MKKFAVQYVRIEHQVYFFEVEAEDVDDAEELRQELQILKDLRLEVFQYASRASSNW